MSNTVSTSIKYPLNSKWILWYHNPSDKNWNLDSYIKVVELNSVEDFCKLKNSWKGNLPSLTEGMFFLMRILNDKIIFPQWEDRHNREGGYWSIKIDKGQSEEIWFDLLMLIIGENITNGIYDSLNINGISISPKKQFCILKVWNNNNKYSDKKLLSSYFDKYHHSFLYTSHEHNISRDTNKKKHKKSFYKNY